MSYNVAFIYGMMHSRLHGDTHPADVIYYHSCRGLPMYCYMINPSLNFNSRFHSRVFDIESEGSTIPAANIQARREIQDGVRW